MSDAFDEVIESLLVPLVAADGGRLEVVERSDAKVVIRLSGACAGCPGVHYTRTHVIVPLVRKALGANVEVVVDNRHAGPTAAQSA